MIQEKKFQILHRNIKVNDAISFVDEENVSPKYPKIPEKEMGMEIKEDENENDQSYL